VSSRAVIYPVTRQGESPRSRSGPVPIGRLMMNRDRTAEQPEDFMTVLNTIGVLAVTVALTACAGEDKPEPFDPTRTLLLQGSFNGYDFDVSEAEATEGEREYSPSRLCEVSAEFTFEIDGAPWGMDLELENFDPDSFGVGEHVIISPDATPAPGQTSFELRLDGDEAHYERSALGGTVDVRIYESDTIQAGTPGALEGGSIGAVFQLDFGAGEVIEGSFNANFDTTTVSDEDC
jgi:hypothetical protein